MYYYVYINMYIFYCKLICILQILNKIRDVLRRKQMAFCLEKREAMCLKPSTNSVNKDLDLRFVLFVK